MRRGRDAEGGCAAGPERLSVVRAAVRLGTRTAPGGLRPVLWRNRAGRAASAGSGSARLPGLRDPGPPMAAAAVGRRRPREDADLAAWPAGRGRLA
ncbi:MAG TPA: hypothetical protein VF070_24880, partial [Streptosporangiaceae bacterium]